MLISVASIDSATMASWATYSNTFGSRAKSQRTVLAASEPPRRMTSIAEKARDGTWKRSSSAMASRVDVARGDEHPARHSDELALRHLAQRRRLDQLLDRVQVDLGFAADQLLQGLVAHRGAELGVDEDAAQALVAPGSSRSTSH